MTEDVTADRRELLLSRFNTLKVQRLKAVISGLEFFKEPEFQAALAALEALEKEDAAKAGGN
jgi:hypothetical protein